MACDLGARHVHHVLCATAQQREVERVVAFLAKALRREGEDEQLMQGASGLVVKFDAER